MKRREPPARRDRGAAALEAGWLVAVVAGFLALDPYGGFGAEADRRLLLRGLALAMLPFAVFAARRAADGGGLPPLGRRTRWVALAALAWTAFASAASIAAERSVFGDLPRLGGLLAEVATLGILCMAAPRLGSGERRARLADALLAAGAATGALAILGALRLTPARFGGFDDGAATALQGNPLFVAALLAPLAPLAVERWRRARAARDGEAVATALVLLALVVGGVVASRARGPAIALVLGIGFQALLARPRAARRGAGLAALAALLLALAGMVVLANRPLAASGTLGQRRALWRGTTALLASEPRRLAAGFGPETLGLALPPHLADELAAAVWDPDRTQDRAHDLLLDAAATTGIVGALLTAGLWFSGLAAALARGGEIASRGERLAFAGWCGAGAAAFGLAAFVAAREIAVPAAGFGALAGAVGFVATRRGAPGAPGPATERLAGVTLAAALATGWLEALAGVRSAGSETLFALLVAAAAAPLAAVAEPRAVAEERAPGDGAARLWLVGLGVTLVAFAIWTLPQAGGGVAPAVRGAGVACAGMVLLLALLPERGAAPAPANPAGLLYGGAVLALLVAATLAGWRAATIDWIGCGALVLGGLGLATALARAAPAAASRSWRGRGAMALGIAALAALAGGRVVVSPWRASLELAAGRAIADGGGFRAAEEPLLAAVARAPWFTEPAIALARAQMRAAAQERDPERENGLRIAERTLDLAARRHPLDATVQREMGYLQARWAEGMSDREAGARHAERALASYARAAALDPTSAQVERGRGGLLLDLGRVAEARRAAERSTRLAPRSVESRLLLGRALLASGEIDPARAAFAAALALDPVRPRRWLEAIARGRPSDAGAQLDWAMLLLAAGEPEAATGPLAVARRVAPPELLPRVESVAAAVAAAHPPSP